ncbi:MAG: SU10 major capsid protein, partial [Cetobacterium sp.]
QFLGVDLSMVEIADLRPVFEEKLAKTGDYVKGHVVVETSIKLFNQYAGFKIINAQAQA